MKQDSCGPGKKKRLEKNGTRNLGKGLWWGPHGGGQGEHYEWTEGLPAASPASRTLTVSPCHGPSGPEEGRFGRRKSPRIWSPAGAALELKKAKGEAQNR